MKIKVLPKEICGKITNVTDPYIFGNQRHDGYYYLPNEVFNREFNVIDIHAFSFKVKCGEDFWDIPAIFVEWIDKVD